MSNLQRYRAVMQYIRYQRGEFCEICGEPAWHGHHIIPVSESSICSELVYEPANIMLLCDDCHALMHPLFRSIDWQRARRDRGRQLLHPT